MKLNVMAPLEVKGVLLDPGHGPNNTVEGVYDPGAVSTHGEHVIVSGVCYEIALQWSRKFSQLYPIRVLPEIGLQSLIQHVNRTKKPGEILISLHMNAGPARAAGTEVIISETAPCIRRHQGAALSKVIARELGLRNRGLKLDSETPRQRIGVLRNTYLPAFLVELGFITNPDDVKSVIRYGADAVLAGIEAIRTEEFD